jgi:hypothetical protein
MSKKAHSHTCSLTHTGTGGYSGKGTVKQNAENGTHHKGNFSNSPKPKVLPDSSKIKELKRRRARFQSLTLGSGQRNSSRSLTPLK